MGVNTILGAHPPDPLGYTTGALQAAPLIVIGVLGARPLSYPANSPQKEAPEGPFLGGVAWNTGYRTLGPVGPRVLLVV